MTTEITHPCLLWLMLIRGRGWRYIKAEPPCMKGEITVSAFGFQLILGWQRTPVPACDLALPLSREVADTIEKE